MKRRPNWKENRQNQLLLAGKIAYKVKAIDPYNENGDIYPVYRDTSTEWYLKGPRVAWDLVGQEFLRRLNLKVRDLL